MSGSGTLRHRTGSMRRFSVKAAKRSKHGVANSPFSVRYETIFLCASSDNLLLVSFCLCGPVLDVSVIGSEGILGIDALTRSGRRAVLRKIFLASCGRSVFPAKILS